MKPSEEDNSATGAEVASALGEDPHVMFSRAGMPMHEQWKESMPLESRPL